MSTGRRGFSELLNSVARTTDPSAIANTYILYSKIVSSVQQWFGRASDGTISQLTPFPQPDFICTSMSADTAYVTGTGTTAGLNTVDSIAAGSTMALSSSTITGLQAGSTYQVIGSLCGVFPGATDLLSAQLQNVTAGAQLGLGIMRSQRSTRNASWMSLYSFCFTPGVTTAVSIFAPAGGTAGTSIGLGTHLVVIKM